MTQIVLPPPLASGRYALRSILGEGGMAVVYRGFDESLQVERAIKVLSASLVRNERIRTRFLVEARTMARLRHPNIVGVFDVGMDGDAPFIVMEMIDGGSLMDLIRNNGSFSPRASAWVTIGLLRGLHQAHISGVIHRDIKPHNLLLTRDGVAKLTDFGIAHVDSPDFSLTRTGAVMGTMAYMAPEQRRSAKDTGIPSDIYSVGATLYVLLKGEDPFDLYASEFYDELFAGVDGQLGAVIQKACSYRPADRYSSAEEMAQALTDVVDALPEAEDVTEDGRVLLSDAQIKSWEEMEDRDYRSSESENDSGTIEFDFSQPDPIEAPGSAGSLVDDGSSPSVESSKSSSGGASRSWIGVGLVAILFAAGWFFSRSSAPPVMEDPVIEAPVIEAPVIEAPIIEERVIEEPIIEAVPEEPIIEAVPEEPVIEAVPEEPVIEAVIKKSEEPKSRQVSEPPAPSKVAATGMVYINAIPWANIRIDGAAVGLTGWKGDLSVGEHTVVLTTEDGRSKRFPISVEASSPARACWNFDEGAKCR